MTGNILFRAALIAFLPTYHNQGHFLSFLFHPLTSYLVIPIDPSFGSDMFSLGVQSWFEGSFRLAVPFISEDFP